LKRALLASTALAAAFAASIPASAAEDDGVYGRFEGDLDLRVGAGAAFAAGGPALALDAAALYLGTAGVYTHYHDALGSDAPLVARSLAAGLRISPLFLGRYASDLEHGPPRLDLFVDSIGFEFGAFWSAPRGGSLRASPGIELGLVASLPIFPSATGLFVDVRGALRYRPEDLGGASAPIADRGAFVTLTLGWHHIVRTHIVDAGDTLRR